MPLPADTPMIVKIIFWLLLGGLTLLFGLCLFWIKRYITSNDEHHKGVDSKLEKQSAENKERDKTLTALANQIKDEANKIDRAASAMARTQADFQTSVSRDLIAIHQATSQIKIDLTEGRAQVGSLKKDLDSLVDTVGKHQHSLSLGAQAMTKQRDEFAKIKSEVIKINEELVIIKGKADKKKS